MPLSRRVVFDAGLFRAAPTNAVLRWSDILAADPAFAVEGTFTGRGETVNAGCHVCELEIDPETGAVVVAAFAAAHDFGRVLAPVVVTGQLHGGIAQGIGQAWMEGIVYDETGQLLSGSLLDYALARADDLPPFATRLHETADRDEPARRERHGARPAQPARPRRSSTPRWTRSHRSASARSRRRSPPARIWRAIATAGGSRRTGIP